MARDSTKLDPQLNSPYPKNSEGCTGMILDLLKFGLIFFLPAILGRAFKLFRELKTRKFTLISWKNQGIYQKVITGIVLIYVIFKLGSISVFGRQNFFQKVNVRLDSPSYIIRNHYRSYLQSWAEYDSIIKEMTGALENESELEKFNDHPLYSEFLNMQKLSEQLKIKEKKNLYSKFGEDAFLNCDYCKNDNDFIMYLTPSAIFEYSLFLILIGLLSSSFSKSNWRNYGLLIALVSFAIEAYAFVFPTQSSTNFEPYDAIFGDDMFTLRFQKIKFIRDAIFTVFSLIVLLFDYGKDMRLRTSLEQLRNSIETSLEFLQATRIQDAALAIDETLQKFVTDSVKKKRSKLASIIADPVFRQKVAEYGHKLNIDELIPQKDKNIDNLIELLKK